MSMRLGLGLGIPCVGRAGGAAGTPAYQQILTLAAADGWTAVYDPTNPDTRTLRESGGDSYAAALADGREYAPDAVQATESKQPQLIVGGAGDLDLLRFDAANVQRLQTALWGDDSLSVPFFLMAVIKFNAANTYAFAAENSSNRNSLRRSSGDALWRAVSTDLTVVEGVDTNLHIYGLLFNNASSFGWVDKEQAVSGDLAGSDALNQLALGGRADEIASMDGDVGTFLVYPGIPSDTVRNGMFDLLHDFTGISKA